MVQLLFLKVIEGIHPSWVGGYRGVLPPHNSKTENAGFYH